MWNITHFQHFLCDLGELVGGARKRGGGGGDDDGFGGGDMTQEDVFSSAVICLFLFVCGVCFLHFSFVLFISLFCFRWVFCFLFFFF